LLEELESVDVGQTDVEDRECVAAGPHRFERGAASRAPVRIETLC
jgi:hypothetical protein